MHGEDGKVAGDQLYSAYAVHAHSACAAHSGSPLTQEQQCSRHACHLTHHVAVHVAAALRVAGRAAPVESQQHPQALRRMASMHLQSAPVN